MVDKTLLAGALGAASKNKETLTAGAAVDALLAEGGIESLSEEQRASLAAQLGVSAEKDQKKVGKKMKPDDPDAMDDEEDDEEEAKGGKKMKPEANANDRVTAVFASEHVKGRTDLAASCFKHFPSATSAQITAFLAEQPAASDAGNKAPEGQSQLEALVTHNNADLGADGGSQEPENHGWDSIHAEIRADRGQN